MYHGTNQATSAHGDVCCVPAGYEFPDSACQHAHHGTRPVRTQQTVPCVIFLQGTSRGGANIKEIVRRIDLWGLDMVFVVGGNGGNAAADAIQQEVERQGVRCVVAGVPKSIDNDILLVSHGLHW